MTHAMKEGAEKIIYNNNDDLKYFCSVSSPTVCVLHSTSASCSPDKTWQQITLRLGNFLNLKAFLFPEELMDFSKLVHKEKNWKKPWKGLLSVIELTNIYALYEPPTPKPPWNPRETA